MYVKGGFIKNFKKVLFERGEIILPVEGYRYDPKPNLLEIKLKDTDSVPEIYYKGERLDESPKGLVDVVYHWRASDFSNDDCGIQDVHIEYYETPNNEHLDKKTIEHHRDM